MSWWGRALWRGFFVVFDWTWDTLVALERKIPRPMPERIIVAIVLTLWGGVTEAVLWNLRATDTKRTAEQWDAMMADGALVFELAVAMTCALGLLWVGVLLQGPFVALLGPYFLKDEDLHQF